MALGILSWDIVISFLFATVVFGCVLNLGAVVIDQLTFQKYKRASDILKLILGSVLEHFGFRQLHLYWRLKGIFQWCEGKHEWGKVERVGFHSKKEKNKLE